MCLAQYSGPVLQRLNLRLVTEMSFSLSLSALLTPEICALHILHKACPPPLNVVRIHTWTLTRLHLGHPSV